MKTNFMMKKWRTLQLITNIHVIHHGLYSYGFTFKPIPIGYFKEFGLRKIIRKDYHDCTQTNIY